MLKIRKLRTMHFWIISVVILLLPLLRQIKPLLFGERYTGQVVEHYRIGNVPGVENSGYVKCSIIEIHEEDAGYRICGPENLELEIGKELPVIHYRGKKESILILTFSGIYLQGRTAAVIIILAIWIAIFFTLKQIQDGNIVIRR